MKVVFAEGGKPEYPIKNHRRQIEIDVHISAHVPISRVVEVRGATGDHYVSLIVLPWAIDCIIFYYILYIYIWDEKHIWHE